jgi:hypothetical protein
MKNVPVYDEGLKVFVNVFSNVIQTCKHGSEQNVQRSYCSLLQSPSGKHDDGEHRRQSSSICFALIYAHQSVPLLARTRCISPLPTRILQNKAINSNKRDIPLIEVLRESPISFFAPTTDTSAVHAGRKQSSIE